MTSVAHISIHCTHLDTLYTIPLKPGAQADPDPLKMLHLLPSYPAECIVRQKKNWRRHTEKEQGKCTGFADAASIPTPVVTVPTAMCKNVTCVGGLRREGRCGTQCSSGRQIPLHKAFELDPGIAKK